MSVNNTTMSILNTTVSVNNTTTSANNITTLGPPWVGYPWGNITTTTYSPVDEPIIYTCCWYWSGLYYFYVLIILLFCISMISLAIGARRRIVHQRQARQRAQANGCDAATANGSACTEGSAVPKPADSPPSYDDAVQNYINAKQDLEAAEEGALAGNIPLNESTTTMETVLETGATVTEISRPSTVRRPTSNTTTTNTTTTNNRQNPNV